MGALLNIQNIISLLLPPNLTNHIKAGMGHVESVRHVVEGHSLVFPAHFRQKLLHFQRIYLKFFY